MWLLLTQLIKRPVAPKQPMPEVTYPPVDIEVHRTQHTYNLAHHLMRTGQSGVFRFRQWNEEFEIVVGNYQLSARPLERKDAK